MGNKKSNNYKKKKNGIENVLYKLMYNVQQTRVGCTMYMLLRVILCFIFAGKVY